MKHSTDSPRKIFTPVIIRVVVLYFVLLLLLIIFTLVFKIKIYSGGDWFRYPTAWGQLLLAWFYIFPFIFGAVGGFLIRPFIRNFVVITGLIFSIHSIYTFMCFSWRSAYLMQANREEELSRKSQLTIRSLTHQFLDDNGDGLVDRIALYGHWDLSAVVPGEYFLVLYLVQNDRIVPGGFVGQQKLTIKAKGAQGFDFSFSVNSNNLKETFAKGDVQLNLELRKDMPVKSIGKRILSLCRWAPFLERTSLEGDDVEIFDTVLKIKNFIRVHSIALDPSLVQREQVIFKRFIADMARDLDGNGRFDELVISVLVDSIYSGPIYYHLQLEGHPEIFFQNKSTISTGVETVHLVIAGTDLKKIGKNGPYQFTNIYILNNDPYCPGGKCNIKNLPMFTIYLPDYVTKKYEINQFE